MMTETNPYKAYTDDTILNSNPLGLVVALYEGAIESCIGARKCLADRDIPGRTKAVNKIVNILTELLRSLDQEKGGEVSQNLGRLYTYMLRRVTDAHIKQDATPLEEVERLLSTMLDGWKGASANANSVPVAPPTKPVTTRSFAGAQEDFNYGTATAPYGGYMVDASDFSGSPAYSF